MAGSYDVIVVGLGAMGSAAAFHLARQGRSVLGLDRFTPPHGFGSSHGHTRIIREAYFEHPLYVPLVQRAYELWGELERSSDKDLLRITGGLMIGRPEGVLVTGARASAELHRLPHELLTATDVRTRFPALCPADDMVALWEPRAGILFPEACVSAHLALAQANGATLRYDEPATAWKGDGDRLRVITDRGEYAAQQVLLTAGAWIPSLVPELKLPLSIERQVLCWFTPRSNAAAFAPARCPIHLWENAPREFFYGFPDLGEGVKLARHHAGESADPDRLRREVGAEEIAAVRALMRRYLPDGDGPLRSTAVCMYTNTPDEHFWIDWHPGEPRALIASPCSGHGFKFASAIGEVLADLLIKGRSPFDLTPFSGRERREPSGSA
jgi:sarcosine oxidase